MRVLVTGGCGFIGGHIVDKLLSLNHNVVVVDNLSAESDSFWYNNSSNVEYSKLDISDKSSMEELFESHGGFDYIFHIAAESRIQPALLDPVRATQVNVVGTAILLNLTKKYSVKRFIYSSTSACYGSANIPPLIETMKNDNLNPYAVTKLAAEDYCNMYFKTFDIPTVSLRYFNVYGPRMPSKGQYAPALAIFMKQREQGKPLTVVGDGLQTRDFVHVSDVVEANMAVAFADKKVCGQAYNVGTGKSLPILEIAKLIDDNITHIPARFGESRHTLCNYDKLRNATGWEPKIELKNGIKKLLEK